MLKNVKSIINDLANKIKEKYLQFLQILENNALIVSCIILAVLAVICIMISYYQGLANRMLSELAPNLACEIIGIILAVIFIDRIIRNNDNE